MSHLRERADLYLDLLAKGGDPKYLLEKWENFLEDEIKRRRQTCMLLNQLQSFIEIGNEVKTKLLKAIN